MSTSFGKVIEIGTASPTYLCCLRCCFYFWQRWKCLCFSLSACLRTRFIYMHICVSPWRFQKNVCLCVCVCATVCVCKQIRLWASEIFQKSNAGLMPLPCDQRIRGFFHYLWRRNTFGCLPAFPSLTHTLPGGRGECWLSEKRCALEKPFNKQCCFGIQESWRLLAALLIHAKLGRSVNSPHRLGS